jgi:uncharacterized protein (DUF433 family)
MTTATIDIGSLIFVQPGFRSGRPCLRGTGMTVHAVAALYEQGLKADEIHAEFEDIDLSLIHAALAYYMVNREQINADWAADRELFEKLQAEHPGGWAGAPKA